jgi:hypothetical protein
MRFGYRADYRRILARYSIAKTIGQKCIYFVDRSDQDTTRSGLLIASVVATKLFP